VKKKLKGTPVMSADVDANIFPLKRGGGLSKLRVKDFRTLERAQQTKKLAN
jgi:hypothetical protein